MSTRRGRGREKSLKDLMAGMANKGGTAVAEEVPPGEPADDNWPPAEPADDDTTAASGPSLTVVPEPREEEPPAAAPAQEPAAEAVPAAEAEAVDVEVVDEPAETAETATVQEAAREEVVDAEVVAEDIAPEEQTDAAAEPTAEVEETGKVLVLRNTGGESELEVQRKRLLPKLPDMVPPPADLEPAGQLAYYEDILSGANRNLGLVVDLAKREWVRYVGWSLGPVRDGELWDKDPEREFESFDAYCREQWGFSGDYANKQIRALPVINVLRDVTAKELKEGPLRVLVRVYTARGEQAVLDTWFRAETEYQSTAAAKLEQAARDLGFIKAGQKDDAEGDGEGGEGEGGEAAEREPQIAPKLTPKERAETWLKPLSESVATDDTKELSATVRELRKLIDRYEAQLKERLSEERRRRREEQKAEKSTAAAEDDGGAVDPSAEGDDADPEE